MKASFKSSMLNFFTNKKNVLFVGVVVIAILGVSTVIYLYRPSVEEIEEKAVEEVKAAYPLKIDSSENSPNLEALSALSFYYSKDNGDEKILYKKNEKEVLPIASISKLMTAQVALDNYNLNDPIGVIERDIVSRTEFRDFRAWKETEIEKIIYQMLIESNNSGAFALALISDKYIKAEKDSVDAFVEEMNNKASAIGLKKTNFVNPSGLDTKETYNSSTAEEIIAWSKYIIDNTPEIFEISITPSYNLYSPDKSIYYNVTNTNTFLHNAKNEWQERIVGGKTGFTHSANGCLLLILSSPERNGYIINIVLGAADRFQEMEKLVNYVYQNYEF